MKFFEQIKEMNRADWRLNISIDDDESVIASASAGQSHCHHNKEYDPSDGHGYSHVQINVDDFEKHKVIDSGFDLPLAIEVIYNKFKSIKPGAQRGDSSRSTE